MHPIAARLVGRPALKNLEVELDGVEKKLARFRQAAEPAQSFGDSIAAVATAFINAPTPERCKAWIAAEAARQGAFEVSQRARDIAAGLQTELLNDLRPQIRAAIDELLVGLAEQRAKVVTDDAAKSAEYGEDVHSTGVLKALDRKVDALEQGKGWVDSDPARSVATMRGVLL